MHLNLVRLAVSTACRTTPQCAPSYALSNKLNSPTAIISAIASRYERARVRPHGAMWQACYRNCLACLRLAQPAVFGGTALEQTGFVVVQRRVRVKNADLVVRRRTRRRRLSPPSTTRAVMIWRTRACAGAPKGKCDDRNKDRKHKQKLALLQEFSHHRHRLGKVQNNLTHPSTRQPLRRKDIFSCTPRAKGCFIPYRRRARTRACRYNTAANPREIDKRVEGSRLRLRAVRYVQVRANVVACRLVPFLHG